MHSPLLDTPCPVRTKHHRPPTGSPLVGGGGGGRSGGGPSDGGSGGSALTWTTTDDDDTLRYTTVVRSTTTGTARGKKPNNRNFRFNAHQSATLKLVYDRCPYPSKQLRMKLARLLGLRLLSVDNRFKKLRYQCGPSVGVAAPPANTTTPTTMTQSSDEVDVGEVDVGECQSMDELLDKLGVTERVVLEQEHTEQQQKHMEQEQEPAVQEPTVQEVLAGGMGNLRDLFLRFPNARSTQHRMVGNHARTLQGYKRHHPPPLGMISVGRICVHFHQCHALIAPLCSALLCSALASSSLAVASHLPTWWAEVMVRTRVRVVRHPRPPLVLRLLLLLLLLPVLLL